MKSFVLSLFLIVSQISFAADFKDALSHKEQNWLNTHPIISYTGDPNYLPYEAFDQHGNHIGMVADYLDIIESKLNISIERVPSLSWSDAIAKSKNMSVDMLSNYTNDKNFLKTHLISDGFIKSPVVIIKQRVDFQPFISDLLELNNEKIALGKKYSFLNPIFEQYPNLDYIEVNNIENVLQGLASKEYDAALVTLNIGTYNIAKHGLRNLQVVGKTDFEMELGLQIKKSMRLF